MVVILEPRISDTKAEDFIRKSAFDKSHRVEKLSVFLVVFGSC